MWEPPNRCIYGNALLAPSVLESRGVACRISKHFFFVELAWDGYTSKWPLSTFACRKASKEVPLLFCTI